MTSLFEHTDDDKDTLQVRTNGGYLRFVHYQDGQNEGAIDLGLSAVENLHSILGEWLNGIHHSTPNAGYIRELVREEVARVLPLHQAPVWEPCGTDPASMPLVPADVPLIPLQGFCTCGHTKWAHEGECRADECTCKRTRQQVRGFETVPVAVPRLMTEVRKRGACTSCGQVHEGYHIRPLCSCGHCTRQHAGAYGSGDCGVSGCTCERYES